MIAQARKWRPLQVAIAWVLTRDLKFCDDLAENDSALQETFCGSARLEHEMLQDGCFDKSKSMLKIEHAAPPILVFRHSLNSDYRGRFRVLAEEYGGGPDGVSVADFIFGRWHDAFRLIADRIADDEISARGVAVDGEQRHPAGEMPSASATRGMWMELDGSIWEGPKSLWGENPRRWQDVTVNWEKLLGCFEPQGTPCRERPSSADSLSPTSEKIRAAIEAEVEATGKAFPILKPVERNKRLTDRMKAMGLKATEIPHERTFRTYFNDGPGKSEESG